MAISESAKKDLRQTILDSISSKYGLMSADVMEKAFKNQDKQLKEAMGPEGGMTASDVAKTRGIDLSQFSSQDTSHDPNSPTSSMSSVGTTQPQPLQPQQANGQNPLQALGNLVKGLYPIFAIPEMMANAPQVTQMNMERRSRSNKAAFPTLDEQAAQMQQVQSMIGSGQLPEGTVARTTAKGGVTLAQSTGLMQEKTKREDAKVIAEDMISGNQPVDFSKLYGASGIVRAELARKGFNVKKGQMDWLATQTLIKTKNGSQQVNLITALDSAQSSIPEMKRLNEEFKRVNFTPANKFILNLRTHGIDFKPGVRESMNPDQVGVATKFITQMNLMKDETATAFMRGGVPSDQAFKLANEILNPVFGAPQLDAALDQVNFNFNIRRGAIQNLKPQGIGGESNSSGTNEDSAYQEYLNMAGGQ